MGTKSGESAKREAIEQARRLVAEIKAQASIRRLRGKVEWIGDVRASRLSRRLSDR